jgi:hypothetical protein|tara:strand:- start:2872 stop:3120 length:249 start_codon:yes stop_codon:yes gene_type:complete
MRAKDYSTLKSGSKVAFSKVGDTIKLTEKRFNSSTGEALSDSVNEVALADYESEKSRLEAEVAKLNTEVTELGKIITDIKAL